jgi:hypothetical protein
MIKYLENEIISNIFKNKSFNVKKIATTVARLPKEDEIGTLFVTWTKDSNGEIKVECRNIVEDFHVIACNPEPIGFLNDQVLHRKWLVDMDTWMENYGFEPTEKEDEYFHKDIVNCIIIDKDVLNALGSSNGESANIDCHWNERGMKVFLNGCLTNLGYGVAPEEFKKSYKIVD